MVFECLADAFDENGDSMSGFRLGPFRIGDARDVAEGFGFEWDGILQMEIFRCVWWYREEAERRRKEYHKRRKEREAYLAKQRELQEHEDRRIIHG